MSEVDGGGAHVREAGPVFQHHAVRTRGRRAVGDLAVLGTYHDPLRRRDLPGRRQAHDRQPRDRHAGTHDLHRRARWAAFHTLRTFLSLAGLAAVVGAGLTTVRPAVHRTPGG